MNNRLIVQLIVVVASVILGMFIYPWLRRKFIRFVEKIYLQTRNDKPVEKEEMLPENEEMPSIVGKSKWNPGHSRTKAATDSESKKGKENASIFASKSQADDPIMKDVEIPLEKIENLSEDEFDEDAEREELETGNGALQASGVSFDELIATGKIIQKEKPSEVEKDTAGEILYQHQSTAILEQITSKDEETLAKVNDLIHFHMKKHNLETEEPEEGLSDSDDFKDFDVNSIF